MVFEEALLWFYSDHWFKTMNVDTTSLNRGSNLDLLFNQDPPDGEILTHIWNYTDKSENQQKRNALFVCVH